MNKTNKKGFTLAELLIVVAIIAVLVAIAIPVFTSQMEKAREAVDAANLRAAYAEVMASHLTDEDVTRTVAQTQTKAAWQNSEVKWPDNFDIKKAPKDGASDNYWTVSWSDASGKVEAN